MQKKKSHLLIQNKFLGALLYFKDKDGRGCLKLSFKNKIAGFVKSTDVGTTMPVALKLDDPISLDVSYKFQDSLLEVKKIVNGKIEPEFYKIPLPISGYLFFIKIKDWRLLDDVPQSNNALVLTPPTGSISVVIIFSFADLNGLPSKPPQYDCPIGMGAIDLPENHLNQFFIGIAEDPDNSSANGFNLYVPFPPEKL